MTVITTQSLLAALNERDLFNNPDLLAELADEVDCRPGCRDCSDDPEDSVTYCARSSNGVTCMNDLAETLRSVGRLSKRSAEGGEA